MTRLSWGRAAQSWKRIGYRPDRFRGCLNLPRNRFWRYLTKAFSSDTVRFICLFFLSRSACGKKLISLPPFFLRSLFQITFKTHPLAIVRSRIERAREGEGELPCK